MATQPATCQYESLSPLQRDICRLLSRHERTGRTALRRHLDDERNQSIDPIALSKALRGLVGKGYVDDRANDHAIEMEYILTEQARREIQRRWCWLERDFRGGARDAV